jgi:serine/threonine protein kinase
MMQLEQWPLLNNRYVPQTLLGKGGFAEVYSCFDLDRLQEVAIKIHKLDNINEE